MGSRFRSKLLGWWPELLVCSMKQKKTGILQQLHPVTLLCSTTPAPERTQAIATRALHPRLVVRSVKSKKIAFFSFLLERRVLIFNTKPGVRTQQLPRFSFSSLHFPLDNTFRLLGNMKKNNHSFQLCSTAHAIFLVVVIIFFSIWKKERMANFPGNLTRVK